MDTLASIGQFDKTIVYTDRPTVKVVIKKDDHILLLNDGLLPGGGINTGETDHEAITRELHEELSVTVKEIEGIGRVVQYRNFLNKKYIINGYTARFKSEGGVTHPQDEGEAQFIAKWFSPEDALIYVADSIEEASKKPVDDDACQGKLYNLMTTYEFLKAMKLD
jgi:8-oxo-dGTP pyrophosphatase MutT (NUDIX family)